MPTITAQSIVTAARLTLADDGTRWPDAEMLSHVNTVLREIATRRPDATNVVASLALASGTKQALPAAAHALLDVTRNVAGRAIRKTSMLLLDQQRPTWHTDTAAATKNYAYDPRTPRVFYVYPPAVAAAEVEIKYQTAATPLAALGDVITIDDAYAPTILNGVLARALLKDVEYNGAAGRGTIYAQAYEAALGAKMQADGASAPTEKAEA